MIEQELALLKRFFSNKESQGLVELNGENVGEAFSKVYASLMIPKNIWIDCDGINKPLTLQDWFGMIKFRDGEVRLTNLYTVPDKLWIHTEEPEVMSKNSVKRRAEWNNQIVGYYVQE